MIMKNRIPNDDFLGVEVYSRVFTFYDQNGPYRVHARAHRLYRGLPAQRPSDKPIKINKKTNAFWVYDTDQRELIPEANQ